MDKKSAIKDLELVRQVFDQNKVPFFLAYGTCLGAYRDKDFLPNDDDIDLGVVEPIDLKMRKNIGWTLYDLGFRAQDVMFNVFGRLEPSELGYNGDAETGIIVCQRSVKFTIFFFKKEKCDICGEHMVCIPKLGAMKLIASPAKFYEKLGKVKFYGKKYNVPDPVEQYLEWTYEEWRNPLKRDHGKLYFETHPKQKEMLEDVRSAQRVVFKNSGTEQL